MATLERRYYFLALAIAIGACAVVGYFAYSAGLNKAIQESYYCEVLHAERELSAIENLQKQDLEAARSNLETGLNVAVVMLSVGHSLMEEKTLNRSHEALLKIKKHRENNPWVGYDENLRLRIQKELDAINEQTKVRP